MLQVTEAAAAVLEGMRQESGAPTEAGVRMQIVKSPDGQEGIGLAFREAPDEGDQVTEQAGVKVFVADELVEPLDGAVLDAQPSEEGSELIVRT